MLVSLGVYYAATDGVLATLASSLLPERVRTMGLAVLGSGIGLAQLGASIAFGALWGWKGPTVAVTTFLIGYLTAVALAAILLFPLVRWRDPLRHHDAVG